MPDITVPVPEGRIPEFHQFFGLWLEGSLTLPDRGIELLGQPSRNLDKRRAWTGAEEEREDAKELWSKMTGPAKDFYNLLIDAQELNSRAVRSRRS